MKKVLKTEFPYTPYEINLIKYALHCILSEMSKLILLLVLFSICGHPMAFTVSLFILLPIRWNSGGIHLKTYAGCLGASLAFFLLAVYILPAFPVTHSLRMLSIPLWFCVHFLIAPLPSTQRPDIALSLKKKYKRRSLLYLFFFGILQYISRDKISAILWSTLTLHTIQLFVAYVIQKLAKGGETG